MYRGYAVVRELARTNPLPLLDLTDKKLISYAESLMPYSVGIEVECEALDESSFIWHGNDLAMESIPYLIKSGVGYGEQRFRVPHGIKGLVSLYYVTEFLKKNCKLNYGSGIHYHIDCTDMKEFWNQTSYEKANYVKDKTQWILKPLKSWNYTGSFNTWRVRYESKDAVKFHNTYKTIEYRIGEMTFDYPLIVKRVLHCQNITRSLKSDIRKHMLSLKSPIVEPNSVRPTRRLYSFDLETAIDTLPF